MNMIYRTFILDDFNEKFYKSKRIYFYITEEVLKSYDMRLILNKITEFCKGKDMKLYDTGNFFEEDTIEMYMKKPYSDSLYYKVEMRESMESNVFFKEISAENMLNSIKNKVEK